ncbi:hypothetical protein K0B96_15510 [Horticoccus luteus]|uniref:Uncharacterized protein n=1 Tax=Horticoccus luteus TaxID=2862869 RepID=A0A8F9TT09_9BACT|nr:hypothetical protein [Horticoccus luteus]QYM78689.1 hypothetical protein K0B96_15510 [Horticoccus luteus]
MSHVSASLSALGVRAITFPTRCDVAEQTAADELARLTDARVASANRPGKGFNVALAHRAWAPAAAKAAGDAASWIWLRVDDHGAGEIIATEGSGLFAAARLLAHGLTGATREKLAAGLLLPRSFSMNRPIWDGSFAQYWKSNRGFSPEQYAATLAEAGFTHLEVNSLQASFPYEDSVPGEYYSQFYTYCPGFNHFIDTPLTRGFWPAQYLDANLERLQNLAALARKYGLKPSVCLYEPRSLPERFFQRYPTLRGARIDHPFRSRLPRYTMAQDHPVVKHHFRLATQALMKAVPDLDAMSIWTNDSGGGFEHTASLYIGRNGGPYMIREWRSADKIAEASGKSIGAFLRNVRGAAAEVNPDFQLSLRIEPFKMEHDHLKSELGRGVHWEGPSMLARGYALPYSHPHYADQQGVAGGMFHCQMDPREKPELAKERAQGIEPILTYSPGPVWNQEPLIGIPWPRMIHARLSQLKEIGADLVSAMGGLANTTATPFWPNPAAIRAAQFTPERSIDDVLTDEAVRFAGTTHGPALAKAWALFEEAVTWQPIVPLFCGFGFCWQRTWDRPLVPDIEAIPAADRFYYERHGCFQHNNPGVNDLGKDVLFNLITRESADKMVPRFDKNLFPRIAKTEKFIAGVLAKCGDDAQATAAFADLRDRIRAYRHWAVTLRSVAAWCSGVYGYLESKTAAQKKAHEKFLQAAIDLEIDNARGLLDHFEHSPTEFMVVSATGENTFIYGKNFGEHLRAKIRLMEKYRHKKPRIDKDILWRAPTGQPWPEGFPFQK